MLKGFTLTACPELAPVPVHSNIRNIVFPFFYPVQLSFLLGIAAACAAFGWAMRDWVTFAFTFSFAFVAFALQMGRFVPYQVALKSDVIPRLTAELDKLPFLRRVADGEWVRTAVFASEGDSLRIILLDDRAYLLGRKADIVPVHPFLLKWAEASEQEVMWL